MFDTGLHCPKLHMSMTDLLWYNVVSIISVFRNCMEHPWCFYLNMCKERSVSPSFIQWLCFSSLSSCI